MKLPQRRPEVLVEPRWRSYDPIAETYARIAERHYFAQPAADLLSLLNPELGAHILDVGAGTGALTTLAAQRAGPTGIVVGLDPSWEMLQVLKRRGQPAVVVGSLPRLPFAGATFDVIAAAFVLNHVSECAAALKEMLHILRPAGRLAVSAWASGPSNTPPGAVCQEMVKEFCSERALRSALQEALPWEVPFTDPILLKDSLTAAGLTDVMTRQLRYSVNMDSESFLESRLISLGLRFVHSVLPHPEWQRLRRESSRRLAEAFGPDLSFEVSVNMAVGSKPT
ncbi:MAG: methyltransferase domain-containing protein [Acidobacteriota bacterium]